MSSWVISSNPATYDAKGSIEENGEVDWITKQSFQVGDTVYIYEVIPPRGRGGIVYKTEVIRTNLTIKDKIDDREYWAGNNYPKDITEQTIFSRLNLVGKPDSGVISLESLRKQDFTAPQGSAHLLDKKPRLLSFIQNHFK